MSNPFWRFYSDIPPITRLYVTATILTGIATHLGLVHPLHLWLDFDGIFRRHQWWRLITNFLYFGPVNIEFLFLIVFIERYSRLMEEGSFRDRPADYVWLILFSATTLILFSAILPQTYMPYLGFPLTLTLVYIWARRNPSVRLNFLGLLIIRAPHFPWVLLAFSLLRGGTLIVGDLLGIGVGHIYYFFEDVWPHEPASGGRRWLKTPAIIEWFFQRQPLDDDNDSVEILSSEESAEAVQAEDNDDDNNATVSPTLQGNE